MSYSEFQKVQKKKEKKDIDVQAADDFAQGFRAAGSSHDHFLRAIGESRLLSKKERKKSAEKEESDFIKKTKKNHEKKVKAELDAIRKRKFAMSEGIFKDTKKKAKKERKEDYKDKREKEEKKEN